MIENIEQIIEHGVEKFMQVYDADENGRCRSFDHVHNFFINNSRSVSADETALRLFAFLGSWGMLRGKSFLFWKDYKYLTPVVGLLLEEKYKYLSNISPFEQSFKKEKYISDVMELKEKIITCLKKQSFNKNGASIKIEKISDTLITKILLGTFACVPAYDLNFVKASKAIGVEIKFSENGLKSLLSFAEKHKETLNEMLCGVESNYGVKYPIMKIIDMALWEYGAELSDDEKNGRVSGK